MHIKEAFLQVLDQKSKLRAKIRQRIRCTALTAPSNFNKAKFRCNKRFLSGSVKYFDVF